MEQSRQLMLDIWREACRHIEITKSVDKIAAMLAAQIAIDRLVIRRIDVRAHHLETLAVGLSPDDRWKTERPTAWSGDAIQRLVDWCRQGQIKWRAAGGHAPCVATHAVPTWLHGNVLIAPLVSEHDTLGLLLLRRTAHTTCPPPDEHVCRALLEPLAVALENDRRFHELNALREAAEADKRSALSRLGRADLSNNIIGDDAGLKPVMERVALVARTDIPVLLLGETGTGKEVIARAVHEQSPRHQGPFIRVNCGAIPPELIDSELFGHERGAFTGAAATRHGWFERANQGTLLLDEIGELPHAAQVRLLRVLQDNSFERVGGERPIRVDVRIVAATHRDLAALVQDGRFREDLWYRIAGMPIILPPLRERQADIPALVEHFAGRAARHFGLKPQHPSAHALQLLMSYHWPGNIRELGAVIDRAAILGDGRQLEIAKALGVTPNNSMNAHTPAMPQTHAHAPSRHASTVSLDTAMRRHIESVLVTTQGRIEGPHGAASLLQINPHTLRARMRKLGIAWQHFRAGG